jgi:hypothetical protein
MSIRAINWAIHLGERDNLSPTMRHILLVLANFASDEDISYPRQTIIAKITGLSRVSVNQNLQKLEDVRLITATGRTHRTGATRSSEYELHINENPAVDQVEFYKGVNGVNTGGVKQVNTGVNDNDSGCQRGLQGGVNDVDTLNHTLEPNLEPKERTPEAPRTHVWPEDYRDQFWKVYPRRRGSSRKEALAELVRIHHSDEVAFSDILTGAKYYADRMNADVKKDPSNEQFIQHAVRWLKKARWETEGPPDKPRSMKRVAI